MSQVVFDSALVFGADDIASSEPEDPDPCSTNTNVVTEGQGKCESQKCNAPRMGGKPRRDTPTREAVRFHWAILYFEQKLGVSGSELARRTGIHQTHINAFRNIQSSGRTGIGAEIVRKMKDGVGLDPAYFYDDYTDRRPVELYLLDHKREEARATALSKQLSEMSSEMADIRSELAALRQERESAKPIRAKSPRAKF